MAASVATAIARVVWFISCVTFTFCTIIIYRLR
jgi:hypothetical protein